MPASIQRETSMTMYGVPLEPGERVIYYVRDEPGWQKPFLIVLGVLLLFAILGVFFLLAGLMAHTTIFAVTTRRFIIINGKSVESIRHGEVKRLTREIRHNRLSWVKLSDDRTTLSYQASVNPPTMDATLELYVKERSAIERAVDVPYDVLAGPLPKTPKA